ncbi:MAG: hypothetical protein ACTSU5_03635 [Promethearchaeota archaeon]
MLVLPDDAVLNVTLNFSDPRRGVGIKDYNSSSGFQTKIYVGVNGNLNYSLTAEYNGTPGCYNFTIYHGQAGNFTGFGSQYLNITSTRAYHQNVSIIINVTYTNKTIGEYQGSKKSDFVVQSENASFTFSYKWTNDIGIEGAQVNVYSIDPYFIYFVEDLSGGDYRLNLSTILVDGNHTYEIYLNVSSLYNETQEFHFTVVVENRTSVDLVSVIQTTYNLYDDSTLGYPLEIYYGTPFNVTARYRDLNESIFIPGATLRNATLQGTDYVMYDLDNGNYTVEITALLEVGDYQIQIQLNKTGFNLTTFEFTVRVLPCPTNWNILLRQDSYGLSSLTKAGNNYLAYYGANIQFATTFTNNKSGSGVLSPVYDFNINGQNFATATGTIDTSAMGVGVYAFALKFNASNYENYSVSVNVEIVACPTTYTVSVFYHTAGYLTDDGTNEIIADGSGFYNIKYGAEIDLKVTFRNSFTSADVSLGTATATIGSEVYSATGLSPTILLKVSTLAVGQYTVSLNLQATNYVGQTPSLKLKVDSCPVVFTLQSIYPEGNEAGALSYDETAKFYRGKYGTNLVFAFNVTNAYTGNLVTGGHFTATIGGQSFTGVEDKDHPGVYLVTVDYKQFQASVTGTVKVSWTLDNYAGAERELNVFLLPPGGGGMPLWMVYTGVSVGAVVLAGVGAYKGIIVPKKRRRTDALTRSATAFEDAINLLHILVIYKQTGTCIYFKSFAQDEINPDLISGFLQAVQTFGTELKTETKSLDEMKYGEDTLLMSDGELVRTTLVLSRPPSQYQRGNLSRFTIAFEDRYRDVLVDWKGQLGVFQGADQLVDEILNASVILPHQVVENIEGMKKLSEPLARPLLKMARTLVTQERPFFFIATLVQQAVAELKKKPPEILIAIEELRNNGLFVPLAIEELSQAQVSPQEMQLLQQKVAALPDFTEEEKNQLVHDLSQLDPVEREAALSSLQAGRQAVTETKEGRVKVKRFANANEASKDIKSTLKAAKKAEKDKLYDKALDLYRVAELTAFQWNLNREAEDIRSKALSVQTRAVRVQQEKILNEAKNVAKDGMFAKAAQLYRQVAELSSELFKNGIQSANKDVKKYNKMASTFEAKAGMLAESADSGEGEGGTPQITKKSLVKVQKNLLTKVKELKKRGDKAALAQLYLDLATVSDELFKFGVSAEAANVKKYRALWNDLKNELDQKSKQ